MNIVGDFLSILIKYLIMAISCKSIVCPQWLWLRTLVPTSSFETYLPNNTKKVLGSIMRWIYFLLPSLVLLLQYGQIHSHLSRTRKEAQKELAKRELGGINKRGFHEESPSFFVSDDLMLNYYILPPYYPSRMFQFLFILVSSY